MASKTFDITTLAGYADVSLGSHQLTIVSEADGYIDSDPSSPVTFINGYPITFNLTECTRTPADTAVSVFDSTTFTLTASAWHSFPSTIVVVGAEYTWTTPVNGDVGKATLVLTKITGAVTITVVAYKSTFNITKTATNGTWTGASKIMLTGTVVLKLTPSTNYKLPTSVTVTNATQSWNASTGELTLTKPTDDVVVSAICPIITYSITETLSNVSKSGTHPTTINAGSSVTLKYSASTNYKLPASVTVTGAASNWTQSTGTLVISNPIGNVAIVVTGARITYTITENLTNVEKSGTHPTFIAAGGTIALVYTAANGYNLPDIVTVTGATSDWKQSTGTLTLTNPTGAVTITITGVQPKLATPTGLTIDGDTLTFNEVENAETYDILADDVVIGNTTGDATYTITTTVTNGSYTGDSTIAAGGTATVTITANDGYTLPDEVTVTGATGAWNKTSGTLSISNPTGNVTVTAVCGAANVTIEAGTYQFIARPTIPLRMNRTTRLDFTTSTEDYSSLQENSMYVVNDGRSLKNVIRYYNDAGGYLDAYKDGTWSDGGRSRKVLISTAQIVNAEWYNWAITSGNLVKQ